MENSTVQSETRWTLHSGLVGGEYSFPISPFSQRLNVRVIAVLGRVCPGKHLAHSSVTLTAASVLSIFDLVKKVDENGREIEPKREYTRTAIR
jgi:ethanolamine transporter EutH